MSSIDNNKGESALPVPSAFGPAAPSDALVSDTWAADEGAVPGPEFPQAASNSKMPVAARAKSPVPSRPIFWAIMVVNLASIHNRLLRSYDI
jgi:hypothetical protein